MASTAVTLAAGEVVDVVDGVAVGNLFLENVGGGHARIIPGTGSAPTAATMETGHYLDRAGQDLSTRSVTTAAGDKIWAWSPRGTTVRVSDG